ncbi:MAG: 4'-phosphopantetheinyl transferase superfamily protein, partial [Clostridia bacterium]|nr:4'-phosphopantetheinyl transferase superfamily protein [Clostridia bacterium]
ICDTEGILPSVAENLPFITEGDKKAAAEYKKESDRVSRLFSAYLKRKYIGTWLISKSGKPVAEGKYFNLSHCDGAVVLAIADADVGVDAEKPRKISDDLIARVAKGKERETAGAGGFLRVWTLKESLVKAQGDGIRGDLKDVPALPENGVKTYGGEKYFSYVTEYKGFTVAVTRKGENPFSVEIQEENLPEKSENGNENE